MNLFLKTTSSVLVLGFILTTNSFAMDDIIDGDYKISCKTRNKDTMFLEAFPKYDVVRPRSESSHQDQLWSIKSNGKGKFKISCFTQNGEMRFLEAFPNYDVVRPRQESSDQDQLWFIEYKGNGNFKIGCDTRNGQTRFLEAFPKYDVVRPRQESSDQDQLWKFERISSTDELNATGIAAKLMNVNPTIAGISSTTSEADDNSNPN